jgi:hypothetical protein
VRLWAGDGHGAGPASSLSAAAVSAKARAATHDSGAEERPLPASRTPLVDGRLAETEQRMALAVVGGSGEVAEAADVVEAAGSVDGAGETGGEGALDLEWLDSELRAALAEVAQVGEEWWVVVGRGGEREVDGDEDGEEGEREREKKS